MSGLVILAVVALVGYAVWQKWRALPPQTKQVWATILGMAGAYRQMKKTPKSSDAQPSAHLMRACARCGLHVPESEGVRVQGMFYCCAEHAHGH
ncbi:MAG: PP0621 family protein [Formosimonas sp.]